MRILITGVFGFIGSHCAAMLSKEHKIIGVDRFSETRNMARVMGLQQDLVYKDLAVDTSGLLENIDVVINFAAHSFVDHSIKDPREFVRNNILSTFNLLEEARRYPVKRFIHISTDEVYGETLSLGLDEQDMLNPGNPYSATKASADMLCSAYRNTFKLPIVILRPENNYGIFQHPQKFIPTIIRTILDAKPVPLYGDGMHRRMWLHVDDFCGAVDTVVNAKEVPPIINIGGKDERENREILKMVGEVLKKDYKIDHIPDEIARPGHDKRYAIKTDLIEGLGWKPMRKLEEALPMVVEWYKKNDWWLR